jgi:hypothetical protein
MLGGRLICSRDKIDARALKIWCVRRLSNQMAEEAGMGAGGRRKRRRWVRKPPLICFAVSSL